MAEKYLDEIAEICLPAKLFRRSVGIAFDLGGSRCKVAFKKRAENGTSKTSDEHVAVVLAGFSRHRLTEALDFVKKNADYSLEPIDDGRQRQLQITGVFFSQKFAAAVESELNLSSGSAVYVDEFSMEKNAINILLKNISEDDVFYPRPHTPWTTSEDCVENTDNMEAPYLILCYGSATGITLVSKDAESTLINGCPEGGVSLLALSKLLVGIDDFAEFMALAERGNSAKVSTTAEQCQQELNEASYFDNFPAHAVVHAFGNTLKPDFNGSREDMARAILENAIQNTASMTVWTALAKNCRTVYYCGGVFDHQLPRDLFCYFLEGLSVLFGKTAIKCRALKHSSFLPVIGAVLDDRVSNNNKVDGV